MYHVWKIYTRAIISLHLLANVRYVITKMSRELSVTFMKWKNFMWSGVCIWFTDSYQNIIIGLHSCGSRTEKINNNNF